MYSQSETGVKSGLIGDRTLSDVKADESVSKTSRTQKS